MRPEITKPIDFVVIRSFERGTPSNSPGAGKLPGSTELWNSMSESSRHWSRGNEERNVQMSLLLGKTTCDSFTWVVMSPACDNEEVRLSPEPSRDHPWLTRTDGGGRFIRSQHRRTQPMKLAATMSRAAARLGSSNDSISTILMYGIIESAKGLPAMIDSNRTFRDVFSRTPKGVIV